MHCLIMQCLCISTNLALVCLGEAEASIDSPEKEKENEGKKLELMVGFALHKGTVILR